MAGRRAARTDGNQDKIVEIVIPDERPASWNQFYSGKHWSKRNEEAKRVHLLMKTYLVSLGFEIGSTFDMPVHIDISAYFKSHPLDADNIAAKLYIDGLKGWLITDDTPQYVARVSTSSFVDKTDPRVKIVIQGV